MSEDFEVRGSEQVFAGAVISVRRDDVVMPDGAVATRDVVAHPGAVGVVALDEQSQVVLLLQYRHPVGERLWELPAGLLDVDGEAAHLAAARELVEEVGLTAARWHVLLDALTSPGMTDEAIRIYLARDLVEVDRPAAVHEEADMSVARVPLGEAVDRVLDGRIRNAMACLGLLTADRAARTDFDGLRPATAPWPDRWP